MWTIIGGVAAFLFVYLNAGRVLAGKFDEEDDDVKDGRRLRWIGQILYLPLEVIGIFMGKLAKILGVALHHLYFAPALLLEHSRRLEKPIRRFKGNREARRLQAAEDKREKEDKAKRLTEGKQEVEKTLGSTEEKDDPPPKPDKLK